MTLNFDPTADQNLTRRQALQACGAAALSMGLAGPLQASNPYGEKRALKVKNLIWIEVNGGLSQLDTFDPKPNAADGIRSPYKTIQTKLAGVHFSELLPRLAPLADKVRLIRTMHQLMPGSGHTDGSHRIMTGQSDVKKDHPYIGSIVARLNPATRNVPSYVWIQETVDVDSRYQRGGAYAPFFVKAGYGGEAAYGPGYQQKLGVEASFKRPQGLTNEELRRRHELLEELEPLQDPTMAQRRAAEFRQMQENALALATSDETREAFTLDKEPDAIRQMYGLTPIGQNLLTARRLIERGVRAVGMPAWAGDYPGHKTNGGGRNMWDHHYPGMFVDNFAGGYGWMVPRVDQAIAALIADLEQRGMLRNTLIVLTGEMGGSPGIGNYSPLDVNTNAGAKQDPRGRGHWPQCWTALLIGGGVTGGVYGASDKTGSYPADGGPVTPETFGATVYEALGIPPDTLLDPSNPLSKISTGQPLMEVLS
jgi:hypothetical protein